MTLTSDLAIRADWRRQAQQDCADEVEERAPLSCWASHCSEVRSLKSPKKHQSHHESNTTSCQPRKAFNVCKLQHGVLCVCIMCVCNFVRDAEWWRMASSQMTAFRVNDCVYLLSAAEWDVRWRHASTAREHLVQPTWQVAAWKCRSRELWHNNNTQCQG